eukprot:7073299-Pyramimonas_sp.AAC.1
MGWALASSAMSLLRPAHVFALIRTTSPAQLLPQRRFQKGESRCCFGCAAPDSLDHYWRCRLMFALGSILGLGG